MRCTGSIVPPKVCVPRRLLTTGVIVLILITATSLGGAHGAAAAEGETASGTLAVGAAKRSIVPRFPTHMGGFGDRDGTFTGVSMPIYARALVCDNGQTRLAVVTTDICYVLRDLVDAVRETVNEKTGIPGENVLICATHSHSGPSETLRGSPEARQRLEKFLAEQIVEAITEASNNLRPAKVGFAYGELQGVTKNRQQHNSIAVDPQVGVLRIQDANSRDIIATLINFTGHPVILGADNTLISGEYPGQAEQTVEDVLGGVALFTQGACGDVTMERSGPPFKEVERVGHVVAGEVIKTAELIRVTDDAALLSKFQPVELGLRARPSVAETETALASARKALADAEAASAPSERLAQLKEAADKAERDARVAVYLDARGAAYDAAGHGSTHVMQIGPLVIVGIPGELFVEYALEMKQRVRQTKDRPLIVAGYANDLIGYIITPRAKYTGGYEQDVARVDEHAGRALTEASMQLVDEFVH